MNKLIQRLIFWPLALLPLAACQNDLPEPPASGPASAEETITVPVTLTVGGGTPLVRDLPPGMEQGLVSGKCVVDRVRLIIFRREETLESEETAPFVYHQEDNQVVNAHNQTFNEIVLKWDYSDEACNGANGEHIFHYELTKKKGYQYKIIALGYNEQYGSDEVNPYRYGSQEKDLFEVTLIDKETTPQSLTMKLTTAKHKDDDFLNKLGTSQAEQAFGDDSPYYYCSLPTDNPKYFLGNSKQDDPLTKVAAPAPEIFYAICTNEQDEEIIYYNDINEIKGHLYRGVAKVIVEIENDKTDYSLGAGYPNRVGEWIALLADNVHTQSSLSSYDQFNEAYEPVPTSGNARWTLLGMNSCTGKNAEGKKVARITTYVLPTVTKLAIRVLYSYRYDEDASTVNYARRNYPLYTNAYSEADNATGIITAVTDGEQFYFRRNKSYLITGLLSEILEGNHELPPNN